MKKADHGERLWNRGGESTWQIAVVTESITLTGEGCGVK